MKPISAFRFWLEHEGSLLIGKGGAEILDAIDRTGSITEAAKDLKMSYKYVWSRLKEMQKNLGQPIIKTRRGGFSGGGGAELTDVAKGLLREYKRVEKYLSASLRDQEYWGSVRLKISARNRIKGTVKDVSKGPITAKIKIVVKSPVTITAVITKEAADELELKPGNNVYAIVKATEVMVAKE